MSSNRGIIRTGLSQLGVLITYPLVNALAGCLVLHITSSGVINNIIVRYLQKYIGKQNIAFAMVGIYAFFVFTILDYIVKILSKSEIDDSPSMRWIRIIKKSTMVSRIQALHISLIDSFPLFAAAVIISYVTSVPILVRNTFSILFVISKLISAISSFLYLEFPRSLFWAMSNICCYILFSYAVWLDFPKYFKRAIRKWEYIFKDVSDYYGFHYK
ncbi:hypothetical protein BCR36DRAFT_321985 [Piromyces finnis]|uniref:Uncharacterized protein n=1 Tax=Piromyces finnis TaxID=1754191 RepID=A0A1Y1VF43_9FUNG|nr:hypothetical protein BCR36DRAFT_321985 [Piromyces finnis]|eukprot:ORX54723.1 hypothetical protein BCR36DRAFT_321985 [Piromyces finnis]